MNEANEEGSVSDSVPTVEPSVITGTVNIDGVEYQYFLTDTPVLEEEKDLPNNSNPPEQEGLDRFIIQLLPPEQAPPPDITLDYEEISKQKLGLSDQTPSEEGLSYLRTYTANNTSQVTSDLVSTKPWKKNSSSSSQSLSSTDSESLLVNSSILSANLGNLKTIKLISQFVPTHVHERCSEEVQTYLTVPGSQITATSIPNISWKQLSIPENTLVISHPLIRQIPIPNGFSGKIFAHFPVTQDNITASLGVAIIYQTETNRYLVDFENSPSIDEYFKNSFVALTMDQQSHPSNSQQHQQLVQILNSTNQPPTAGNNSGNNLNASQPRILNPHRIIYALTKELLPYGLLNNIPFQNNFASNSLNIVQHPQVEHLTSNSHQAYTTNLQPQNVETVGDEQLSQTVQQLPHQDQPSFNRQLEVTAPIITTTTNNSQTTYYFTNFSSLPVPLQNTVPGLNVNVGNPVANNNQNSFNIVSTKTTPSVLINGNLKPLTPPTFQANNTIVKVNRSKKKNVNNQHVVQNDSIEVRVNPPPVVQEVALPVTLPPPEVPLPPWPKFELGKEAICHHCGDMSQDLHQCHRCKTRFREGVKFRVVSLQEPSVKKAATKKSKSTSSQRKSKGGSKQRQEECIVLSSDDEDQPKSKKLKSDEEAGHLNGKISKEPTCCFSINSQAAASMNEVLNQQRPSCIVEKNANTAMEAVIKYTEEAMTSPSFDAFPKLDCRSIRIGDYRPPPANPPNKHSPVIFSEKWILLSLPHAQQKNRLVQCAIPNDQVLQTQVHFSQKMPVIFITTEQSCAKNLRTLLGLCDSPASEGFYYCPIRGDKCQRRITFLPEQINDQDQAYLKSIFKTTFSLIDSSTAHKMLLDSTRSPELDNQSTTCNSTVSPNKPGTSKLAEAMSAATKTTEKSSAMTTEMQSFSQVDMSENKTLLSYQGIAILQQDILCLADEQFLNDSIIDFWLRYIEHEILSPVDKSRTYMFSTFFYKRLTTKPKKKSPMDDDPNLTSAEKRHNRVKRWTKNVDIFDKDFLIMPINESLHWFLAVICYPGLQGVCDLNTGEPIPDYKSKRPTAKTKVASPAPAKKADPITNGESQEAVATNVESNCETQGNSQTQENNPNFSEIRRIKQPCILILDSLVGEPRNRVYSTIREYLKMEYKTRKGEEREFTKNLMPGGMPKVPQQPNHCDCGIYTLFYAESFFKFPISTFDISILSFIHKTSLWNGRIITKREDIYNSIRRLIESNNPEALKWLPKLIFSPYVPSKIIKPVIMPQTDPVPPTSIPSSTSVKLENVSPEEEPMDIDVESTTEPSLATDSSPMTSSPERPLAPSRVESARASPSDSEHDHDYIGAPLSASAPPQQDS